MATCMQLAGLLDNGNLRDKAVGACLVVAENVRAESPGTAARRAWAKGVIMDPTAAGQQMLAVIVAKNNSLANTSISGISDADMVTSITAFVDIMTGI